MDNMLNPYENFKTKKRYRFLSKTYRELLDNFYAYLLGQQLATMTIRRHWHIILRFFEFLETIKMPEITRVNIEIANTFLVSSCQNIIGNEQPGSIKYAYSYPSALKRLFNFLHETGIILINPAPKIKLPKKEKSLPRGILTQDEARRLLDSQETDSFIGLRNKVILELLYGCGLRGLEVRSLKLDEIDLNSGLLMIKEKKDKNRCVPLNKAAAYWLNRYLSARRIIKADSPYLFLAGHESVPVGYQIIWHIVRVAAKKAKIAKPVIPSTLRESYATHLLEDGAPLNAVQALLGHAHIERTQAYPHVAIPQLKGMHSRFHPRERVKVFIEGGKIIWKTK